MDPGLGICENFFKEHTLTSTDLLFITKILSKMSSNLGKDDCWVAPVEGKQKIDGFYSWGPARVKYKGADARVLVMAIVDQYRDETQPVLVRKGGCIENHCINPHHFYYGTKRDVCFENNQRNGRPITPSLIRELRSKHETEKFSFTYIAKTYNLPYHLVRRICNYVTYE